MKNLRLAYRDDDRTPVIFCIKEMAERHYDLNIEVLQIKGSKDYEAALFNGACDVLIEHLEFLYEEVTKGAKITFFCAPSKGGNLSLVVPPSIKQTEQLKGKTMAVRTSGQPHAIHLWLKMMGLDKEVKTLMVKDSEVGRWEQWRKIVSGECIASFISPIYLPSALAAGLSVLPVPDLPIVGHYAQVCLSKFARENSDLMKGYMKAVIHALSLITIRREEALEIVSKEPMKRMKIDDMKELARQFDSISEGLKINPYPSLEAIANTYEIAAIEYPAAKGLNPLTLWDLHWVKELDDEGFIDGLVRQMNG